MFSGAPGWTGCCTTREAMRNDRPTVTAVSRATVHLPGLVLGGAAWLLATVFTIAALV